MNKRLLIALVLSFLVLTMYGYLVPKPEQVKVDNNSSKVSNSINQTTTPSAPTTADNVENSSIKVSITSDSKIIATVETNKYRLKIDNLGRVASVVLKEKKYTTEDGKPLDIIANNTIKPLEVRFKDNKINDLAFKTDYSVSVSNLDATKKEATITLEQDLGSVKIKKILTFYPDGNYNLDIEASKNVEYFVTPGFRPVADKSMYLVVRGVIVRDSNGVVTTLEDGDVKDVINFPNSVVVASVDRYYATLFYKKEGVFSSTIAQSGIKGYESEPVAFINIKKDAHFKGYIGPKEWKLFSKLDKKLEDVVEFGWFTFLAKPFFKIMLAIYEAVGNWGWAIVLFTILVKIVLFPLSYKGLMSMQKLKDLAPKMKEIREKYGKDPAKMNQQMMNLYKKHGANPMGGCLPMLLQIPIFFALYRVLLNADELQGAAWIGWITDLSRQDPYFVLPILMGITMYVQQKITPNTMTDPMQQKIFQWLPVIMTFFFLTFPSGLVLYWLVNNILTIAQQYYINIAYEKYKQSIKAAK